MRKGPQVEKAIREHLRTVPIDERNRGTGTLLTEAAEEIRRVNEIGRQLTEAIGAGLRAGDGSLDVHQLQEIQDLVDRIKYP